MQLAQVERPDDVFIITGTRKWYHTRKVHMSPFHVAIIVAVTAFVFFVLGCIFNVVVGTETMTRSSVFYREAIARGDAAMAMLHNTAKELERIGNTHLHSAGKKVVLAEDLNKIKEGIGVVSKATHRIVG